MQERDELSDLLKQWQPTVSADPAFRANVWQRLEERSTSAAWFAHIRMPAAALFTVIIATSTGVIAGVSSTPDSSKMAAAYARSIDPLQINQDASPHAGHTHP